MSAETPTPSHRVISIDLGRFCKKTRRQKLHPDGRPVTLDDAADAISGGGGRSVLSEFETHGRIPKSFHTMQAYVAFLGLDINKILAEFEQVRAFYERDRQLIAGASTAGDSATQGTIDDATSAEERRRA
jgi:hypothetical protein